MVTLEYMKGHMKFGGGIWDSFTPEQQKKIYSDLDSKGYLYGWNKGLPLIGVPGVGHGARLALAASYSAYFSYTATRM